MAERNWRPRSGRRLSRPRVPGEEVAPVPIGEAMAAVGEELGIGDPRSVGRLESSWSELVGPAIAEHAHVRSLRRGVLTIAVDAAPWATQLRYLETEIVDRAATLLGEGQVTQARIVVDAPARAGPSERRDGPARGAREDPQNDAP